MDRATKLISLLRPMPDERLWDGFIQDQLAAGVVGLQRLILNTVLPVDVRTGSDGMQPFSAIVESWFADRATADIFASALRTPGDAVQMVVDAVLICDSGRRPLPNKIMVTLKRRADLTREQAQHHWRTRHVEVGLVEHNASDFLRLYFQNHVIDSDQPPGSPYDYDGMPEYWVVPSDLASVGEDSPVMRAIAEDEVLFIDKSAIVTMMVIEREMFVANGVLGGWQVTT